MKVTALRVPAECQCDANVLGFLGFLGVTSMIHRWAKPWENVLKTHWTYEFGHIYAKSYDLIILYSKDRHGKVIRNAG